MCLDNGDIPRGRLFLIIKRELNMFWNLDKELRLENNHFQATSNIPIYKLYNF